MKKVVIKSVMALLVANIAYAAAAEVDEKVEVVTDTSYPVRVYDRPAFFPPGLVEADVTFNSNGISKNRLGFDSGMAVGVTNHMQARLGWSGMAWSNFELDHNSYRTLSLTLSHRIIRLPFMGARINAVVPFNINIDDRPVLDSASFATQLSFLIGDRWLLWMLNNDTVKIGPGPVRVSTSLPVNFGGQIVGNFWADVRTNLGTIKYGYAESTFFWQELPLTLMGVYAFNNKIDLIAAAGMDVLNPDATNFSLGFAYRPNA